MLFAIFFGITHLLAAQKDITNEAFKTAFIFQLLDKIEWKNSNSFTEYRVGVVGNEPELLAQLNLIAANRSVREKAVTISTSNNLNDMSEYHLLFISVNSRFPVGRIANRTQRSNTLLVTENTGDKNSTMINLIRNQDTTYSFEINKANIVYEGLSLDPDILLLGGTEMDVAELYKKAAFQLESMREELSTQRHALIESRAQVLKSQQQLNKALAESEKVRAEMLKQAKLLATKTRLIEQKNISIREKEGELLAIQTELQQASNLLRSNQAILGEKLSTIANKEQQVSSLSERINNNLAILEQQRTSIEQQRIRLREQTENLAAQGTQIQKQRGWLATGAVIILIIATLLLLVIYYNKERRKTNKLLLEKNQALNNAQKELLVARDLAQSANEAKSSFLANMSHEIRTPMNAIIGMLHLARQTELNKTQDNYLKKIDAASNSLLGIINDILDFSKVEAGELSMESIEFDLSMVLDDLSNLIGLKIQQKGLEFIFQIDPKIPEALVGDPLRLSQVLVNLTNNALKFTEKGEVKLSVNVIAQDDRKVRLNFEVSDTGIGMTDATLQRLFKPFSQADSSTTRQFGGTGLGLAICKRLVEQMRGSIKVTSHIDRGSSFSFTVEFDYHTHASPELSKAKLIAPGDKRVLVVVENESHKLALQAMLRALGYRTATANGFESCVGIVSAATKLDKAFDALLIEHKIVEQHDEELNKLVKAYPAKTILLLGAATDTDQVNTLTVHADDTLYKPVTPSSLLDSLLTLFVGTGARQYGKNQSQKSKILSRSSDKKKRLQRDISKLQNRKILVVEDNIINQEVMSEILKQAKLNVDIAFNGLEAIKKIGKYRYDAVLMDIQMPEMDGYQAARKIRSQYGEELPIIAMTANAMGGDREKCLDAGMNDYVSKPIEVASFFHTLKKWVSSDKLNPHDDNSSSEEQKPTSNAKQFTGPERDAKDNITQSVRTQSVDLDAGIQLMGTTAAFVDLLKRFETQQSDFGVQAKALLKANEFDELSNLAHDIKGVTSNLFIRQIPVVAVELGVACNERDAGEASVAITKLDKLLQRLSADLKKIETDTSR